MKRDFLIPISLILASLLILLSGWGIYLLLDKDSKNLLEPVQQILVSVENNSWEKTDEYLKKTNEIWERINTYWPLLINHKEMDQIEESINRLKSYLKQKDKTQSLAELYNLIYFIKHIPQKEAFNLQNIF